MKTKRYLSHICSIAICVVAISSCSSWLDEQHPTSVTNQFLFETERGLKAAVTGLYEIERDFISSANSDYYANQLCDGGTDLDVNWSSSSKEMRYRTDIIYSESGIFDNFWKSRYRIIERANSIIDGAKKTGMSDAARAEILREAYTYRAYAYFFLIRRWDNIWLNILPTTDENYDKRVFEVADKAQVYKVITDDLDAAIEMWGDNWTKKQGRFSQAVARLIRADVAMWLDDWDTAITHTNEIINKGGFSLETDISKIFPMNSRYKISKETMRVMEFDELAAGGGGGQFVCSYPVSSFGTLDGCVRDNNMGGYGWGRIMPNEYFISLFDAQNDKRYDGFFIHYYTCNNKDFNFSKTKFKYGDTIQFGHPKIAGTDYFRRLAVTCKKYFDPERQLTSSKGFANLPIDRYPMVLLLAAEANWRKNGNTTDALGKINELRRNRITEGAPGRDIETLSEQVLMDEWARELGFEGHRWFLLKRYKRLISQIKAHGGMSEFHGLKVDDVPSADKNMYSARLNIKWWQVRWPIPQSEINSMGSFPQNPGYDGNTAEPTDIYK